MGAIDEISMKLGRLEAQLEDGKQERAEMRSAVNQIGADVRAIITATQDFPEIKKIVRKQEQATQRRTGFIAAISAGVSIAVALSSAWLSGHFK